ncbi:hypothetical protein [Streptomyces sp. NPDC001282]|uniref:hypothetical protein n=1 Tax=Streptomyces sp. NPDC001282 TaxID=3364557 RepID=UPI0036C8DA9F
MFNRIRRAVSLARERYFHKGRHRRPLTLSRPMAAFVPPAPIDRSTADRGRVKDCVDHAYSLAGEDIALVRPYVLAWEKHVRQRSTVLAPHLPTEAWSALAGAP